MRILYCNKYNHPFSGTEVYLFELMELMRSEGHQVALFSMADPRGDATPYDRHFVRHIDFKNPSGLYQKARNAGHAMYSLEARRRIRAMIKDFHPDVAHVRNIYHHLSPSILWELQAQGVRLVYHLNDFKLLCPSYNLVSQGQACEACKGGSFWHALRSECYPGMGARLALTAEAYIHEWLGTYRKCVDRFLAPSRFVRDTFIAHGWDAAKFEVLPHFQTLPSDAGPPPKNAPLLYFGRLSPEKGVDDLLRAMKRMPHLSLVIAGDGSQRGELQGLAKSLGLRNVEFVGHVRAPELAALLARSRFTVLPSHAYETLGKTILESYAVARAVVASDLGSRREFVHDGETGILYPVGDVDRLAEAIESLSARPDLAERMGLAGRELVRERHTPEQYYQAIVALYSRLLNEKKAAPAQRALTGIPRSVSLPHDRTHPVPTAPSLAAKPKLRIAFIGGRGVISKYSGIEAYYEEVGKRLVRMGHKVTVYCRTYFTPRVSEFEGMRVVRLPTIRTKHLETVIHTLLSTAHVLFRRCDLVHYHALGPALFSFVPRLTGKKTVVTVQGLDWQRKKWGRLAAWVLRLGEWAAAHLPSATMVVSKVLQQHFREVYGTATFYVSNGGVVGDRRPARKILPWDLQPGQYILFLGRFSPEKNCHLLVDAYEKLNTSVKLVLAGASSYCDGYSREIRAHAGEHIKVLDWVSGETLDELLTNAMIFVLPSDLEGLSLALLDAMGAGLCVVTSDVPENREVVEGAGFTFQRGNAEDLAHRLRFLIANPSARAAAGRAAQERIREHYQWAKVANDIEKVYFAVMGSAWPPVTVGKPSSGAGGAGGEVKVVDQRQAG